MNDEFQQLTIKRSKWVEANQENGFDEGIKRLLTDLYPDNAHFIYELLQNAEDAGASSVKFILNDDGLEFSHDGGRLFSIKDVESITSIGNSTKRDDPTSIGKFGVGFKAVFAYTNTPQVRSGNFAFRIEHLVIPRPEPFDAEINHRTTHFLFPFNNPSKPPAKARDEIESVLRSLGDNTLLFLNNIRHIQYALTGQRHGLLFLEEGAEGEVRVNHRSPLEDTQSHWLRFEKEVKVLDDDGQFKICRIAIAYRLIEEEQKKTEGTRWKVAPVENGQVSIYFPAEKETSNLRFHLHAPFASTVARDSVRDCRANDQLRDHLAKLTAESLFAIRDKGLLTVGFLGVLPNPSDGLPEFYEPIRRILVDAFKTNELTPTRSGVHASAVNLYRGPVRISEVLDDEDLAFFTSSLPPLWSANPPQQNQREDRFLESLDIRKWGFHELKISMSFDGLRGIFRSNLPAKEAIEAWLKNKDDAWVMRFYVLLYEAGDTYHAEYYNPSDRKVDFHSLRIVRIKSESGNVHELPGNSFFSPAEGDDDPPGISFVKSSVYAGGRSDENKRHAKAFLERIGVRLYDAKAEVELKLAAYKNGKAPKAIDLHLNDMKEFVKYWLDNPGEISRLRDISIFLSDEADAEQKYFKPSHLYLDVSYYESALSALFDDQGLDWLRARPRISSKYIGIDRFADFSVALGVMCRLEIRNYDATKMQKDIFSVVGKKTSTTVDEDYFINGLHWYNDKSDYYIGQIPLGRAKNRILSLVVWKTLCLAEPH